MNALAQAIGGGSPPSNEPPTWIARSDLGLFAIASPCGGSRAAALHTLDAIATHVAEAPPDASRLEALECSRLRAAILAADAQWVERASADKGLRGVGTALAAVLQVGNRAAIAHLGDCRVHQLREGRIERATQDHVLPHPSGRI